MTFHSVAISQSGVAVSLALQLVVRQRCRTMDQRSAGRERIRRGQTHGETSAMTRTTPDSVVKPRRALSEARVGIGCSRRRGMRLGAARVRVRPGAWTLWKDVDKAKYRTEEGTGRKEAKKTWSSQEYRQATCERAEQDCPARKWERYPEDSQEPRYT